MYKGRTELQTSAHTDNDIIWEVISHTMFPVRYIMQDRLYSCSFNKIHIWKGHEDFKLIQEKETSFGAIYSLALTKKYLITGVCVCVDYIV